MFKVEIKDGVVVSTNDQLDDAGVEPGNEEDPSVTVSKAISIAETIANLHGMKNCQVRFLPKVGPDTGEALD
jgi:hypothetical protein